DSPPFVEPPKGITVNVWTMSQRAGSATYLIFSAGVSLAVYALFVVLCDGWGLRVGLFRTFGQNALAAHLLHSMVAGGVKPYAPSDSPLWYIACAFLLYFLITYSFIRYMERQNIFLRL